MTWAYGMRMDAPNEGTDYRSIRDTDGCAECANDVNLAEELVDADRPVLVVVHAVRPLPRIPLPCVGKAPATPPHLTHDLTVGAVLWGATLCGRRPAPESAPRAAGTCRCCTGSAAHSSSQRATPHDTPHATPSDAHHAPYNVGNNHSRTRRAHTQAKQQGRRCGAVRCGACQEAVVV